MGDNLSSAENEVLCGSGNETDALFAAYRSAESRSAKTEARNRIVLEYMSIVRYAAVSTRNMYQKYTDTDDIINEATIALMGAVESFDPDKNVKFATYASKRVRGAIIDYIRKLDVIPRNIRRFAKEYDAAFSLLYDRLGREPTNEEIAQQLEIPLNRLEKYVAGAASVQTLSFEEMVFDNGFDISDSGGEAASGWEPEKRLLGGELHTALASAVDKLKDKERLVISLYYYEKLKYSEIAQVMDISESRVCQLHSSAVTHLKKYLGDYLG